MSIIEKVLKGKKEFENIDDIEYDDFCELFDSKNIDERIDTVILILELIDILKHGTKFWTFLQRPKSKEALSEYAVRNDL